MTKKEYRVHKAAEVLPMLSAAEHKKLSHDIRKRGLLTPILIYHGQILDGRNRLKACQEVGVEPRFKVVDFELDERGLTPLEFVISLNLRRRHLNASQIAMAAAEALPEWAAKSREISLANLRRGSKRPDQVKKRSRGNSDFHLAKMFGISPRYVTLAAEIRRKDKDLAEEVANGETTLSRARRRLRESESEKRREAEARRIANYDSKVDIYRRDIESLYRIARPVQLILTDPPYAKNCLPLWDQLGLLASNTLTQGGFLGVVSGLQYLDEVMHRLAKPNWGLKYYWTVCVTFSGHQGRRHRLRMINSWRPVLFFFKPPFRLPSHQLIDKFTAKLPRVKEHRWQQRPDFFEPLVEGFSGIGDWVLDPFAGSGAVLEACRKLSRNAIGADKDSTAVALMERRLGVKCR